MKTRIAFVCSLVVFSAAAAIADPVEDQFNFATGLMIKNEHELAAEEFRALLKDHPDFTSADVAWFRLGEVLHKLRKMNEAEEAFLKVTAQYPKSDKLPQAYYRLGEIVSDRNHRDAARYFAAVAEKWPDNALAEAALYWSAEELFKAEDWKAASAAYAASLAKFPQGKYSANSLYSLGWSDSQRGQFEAAAKSFRSFLEKFPAHELAPECRLKMAEALTKAGKHDDAFAAYTQAGSAGGKFAPDAAMGAAWCLYEQGKFPAAADAFIKAAALLGKDPRAATCTFNAGNAFVESKDFQKATAQFEKTAAEFPGHELAPAAAYWRGYCLVRLGKFDEAVAVLDPLKTAGTLKGKDAEVLHALAEARFGQKKFRDAAALYAEIAAKFQKHALADEAAYGRMLALEKAGDLETAEKAGQEFFTSFSASPLAHLARFALGEYRFRLKKYAEAAADFEAFLAGKNLAELGADAEYKLGWCRMNLGKGADAVPHFNAVVTKYPKSPLAAESAYFAGRAAEEAGDKAGARKHYENCVQSFPGTEHALMSDLAVALLDFGDKKYADSLARAEAFLKKNPDHALSTYAFVYKGEALLELGRPGEALAAYRSVKPGREDALTADSVSGAAWALRKMGKHEEAAESFFKAAALKSPKAEDAGFWGCRSLEDAGKFQDAAQRYEKFVAGHPNSKWLTEATYRHALCTFKARRPEEARKLYLACLEKQPKSEFADNALYDLAWMARENGDPGSADKHLQQLLKDFPASDLVPDVKFRLGEMAQDAKDYAGAATWYESILAGGRTPFDDKVLYKLGWCHDYQNNTDKAAAAFLRLCKDCPRSDLMDEAHYRAGKLLQKAGQLTEAIREYAAVGAGDFAERALFQNAECLRLAGNHKEALDLYNGTLQKYPKTEFAIQVNLGKGHCYRTLGAFQDAADAYELVVKATDTIDAASALIGIGYSQFAREQYKEAAKTFLKVDILYGYEELKPEALAMTSKSWEKAGDAEKAGKYRQELERRYPDSKFAKEK